MTAMIETSPTNVTVEGSEFRPPYNYLLTDLELDAIEADIVDVARGVESESGAVAIVVGSEHPAANFVRTYEQSVFAKRGEHYDFSVGMAPYEERSFFLLTVDTTADTARGVGTGGIAHIKRLVLPHTQEEVEATGLTGLEMIDDRLKAEDPNERASFEDLVGDDSKPGRVTDIQKTINVATNMTTDRVSASLRKPHSLLSYKAVFMQAIKLGTEQVIAYQNIAAIRSVGKLGIEGALLGGEEFHLPRIPITDGYDTDYIALVIPVAGANVDAFTNPSEPARPLAKLLARITLPTLDLR